MINFFNCSSIIDAIQKLRAEKIEVTGIIVIMDRRTTPGPIEDIPVYSVLNLGDVLARN